MRSRARSRAEVEALTERLLKVAAADPELTARQLADRFGLSLSHVKRLVATAREREPARATLTEAIAKVKGVA